MTSPPEAGDVYTYERTVTTAEVRQFGELSGDQQPIHTDPDEEGRLVVQGLLTATLPTAIGGDLEVLATRRTGGQSAGLHGRGDYL
ncbi:MaoC domain-containing protein dehydratase [Halobiforma lacisalsi AJ5]|uniref:MaoC domain-containing protein dehydratase n=1 Tax=Natronobacterium lacisalsi AJ5 TaxID=358396 RepID=M0LPP5_NATLA|nr:MaoC domain-containing protein dehydratase [Halobiforma lacisalsi AJ5]